MKMTMNAALLAATFTAFVALPAQAQITNTVTASVNARAGLAPLLAVTCDPVNFGVWRVPVRGINSGGTTLITLTVSANNALGVTTYTPTGNLTNVSLAPGYNLPEAGTCRVTGAVKINSSLPVGITGNTNLPFIASNHELLPTPSLLADLRANLTLAGTQVNIDGFGAGSFRVTGVLTIPEPIVSGNYGGYQTGTGINNGGGATVSVTDTLSN